MDWQLECTACGASRGPEGLPTVCACGQPWLVRYPARVHTLLERAELRRRAGMWRFRSFLPLAEGERPVTLGEGDTPLLEVPRIGRSIGLPGLLMKDEALNPTGSFKSRGLSAAVTRAVAAGAAGFALPTAGNAGVAAAAYGARAGVPVAVVAPASTPAPLLRQMAWYGAEVITLPGHIGDCGVRARALGEERGWVDLSTLREPYRIEGKKTLGLELAMQLGWRLPHVIVYPTGGGTGLIGMWKAFTELQDAGWVTDPMPRFVSVQSAGCAPVVRAFAAGDAVTAAWADPETVASGLRVPAPLGGRLMLQALRESDGAAVAVDDATLSAAAVEGSRLEGLDLCPEGGAALAAAARLRAEGRIEADATVVVFNTGAGWLYRP